jgi:hypothetical protein
MYRIKPPTSHAMLVIRLRFACLCPNDALAGGCTTAVRAGHAMVPGAAVRTGPFPSIRECMELQVWYHNINGIVPPAATPHS